VTASHAISAPLLACPGQAGNCHSISCFTINDD
jgi:hypothetical protein